METVNAQDKAPSPSFIRRRFGSGRSVPAVDFVVFGLLTFWIYTCVRLRRLLRDHLADRWQELGERLGPGPHRDVLRADGFAHTEWPIIAAAVLYGMSALVGLFWFYNWILTEGATAYAPIVLAVAASSAFFYAATVICALWMCRTLHHHELYESLLLALGPAALANRDYAPSDAFIARWEALNQKVALFLVASLPMAFSPTVGAHLFLSGTVASHEILLAAACFVLAAVFHVWGTIVIVGLFNSHLAYESDQAIAAEKGAAAHRDIDVLPSDPPRRELAAIMLTDICGYSKSMERDEDATFARLQDHNRIVRAAIRERRGREIKTIGDAFLVIFRSALDAVDCALDIQRSLADYNLGRSEDARIEVRIGVHLGDLLITHNDVFGDSVNVTARIETLADAGGICVSEEVYALVRKKVELVIEPVKDVALKNIAVPPGIYRLRLRSAKS